MPPFILIVLLVGIDTNRKDGSYYRIDNTKLQLVDLTSSAPELDLRYRVGDETPAIVVIHLKPAIAEKGMHNELIERRGNNDFGFSSRYFMEIVKESMIHSASNDCRVCICWKLVEEREEGFLAKIIRMVMHPNVVSVSTCAAKVIAKTVGSESLERAMDGVSSGVVEIAAKVLTQDSSRYVSENILKRIPFLGILAVLILALGRLWSGDLLGAACEVISGCSSGWGVIVSVALDVMLCVGDLQESGAIKKPYGNCVMAMICVIIVMITITIMTMA